MRRGRVACLPMVAFVAVTLGVLAVGTPPPAHACSCMAPAAVQHRLGQASVAFVGTAVSKQRRTVERVNPEDPSQSNDMQVDVYLVRVAEVVKGEVGSQVEVVVGGVGTSCEIGLALNQEFGFVPAARDDELTFGACSGFDDADQLRVAATGTMPAPTGLGAVSGLIAAPAGPANVTAVDDRGRILGYITGVGEVVGLAACPGGRYAVIAEYAYTSTGAVLSMATVDVRSLSVTRRAQIPSISPTWWMSATICTNDRGDGAMFFPPDGSGASGRLVWVNGDRVDVESAGAITAVAGTDAGAVIGLVDGQIVEVTPDGSQRVIAELPDGSLGGPITVDDRDVLVALVENTANGRAVVGVVRIALNDGSSSVVMLDRQAVLIAERWDGSTLRTYDPQSGLAVHLDAELRRLPATDPSIVGTAIIGDASISWDQEGTVDVQVDGRSSDSLVALGLPTHVEALQPTTTVDPDSPGAAALPYILDVPLWFEPDAREGAQRPGDTREQSNVTARVVVGVAALVVMVAAAALVVRRRAQRDPEER